MILLPFKTGKGLCQLIYPLDLYVCVHVYAYVWETGIWLTTVLDLYHRTMIIRILHPACFPSIILGNSPLSLNAEQASGPSFMVFLPAGIFSFALYILDLSYSSVLCLNWISKSRNLVYSLRYLLLQITFLSHSPLPLHSSQFTKFNHIFVRTCLFSLSFPQFTIPLRLRDLVLFIHHCAFRSEYGV